MTEVVCDFCSDYQRHNRSGGNGERRACGLQEYVRQRICPVRRGIRLHIPGFPSWLFHREQLCVRYRHSCGCGSDNRDIPYR